MSASEIRYQRYMLEELESVSKSAEENSWHPKSCEMSRTYNVAFTPDAYEEQIAELYSDYVDAVSEISQAGQTADADTAEAGSTKRKLWEALCGTEGTESRYLGGTYSLPPTRITCNYSAIRLKHRIAVIGALNREATSSWLLRGDSFLYNRQKGASKLAEAVAIRMSRNAWRLNVDSDPYWDLEHGKEVFILTVQILVYSPLEELRKLNPRLLELMSHVNRSGRQRWNDWMAHEHKVQMILGNKKQMNALAEAVALVLHLKLVSEDELAKRTNWISGHSGNLVIY